MNKCCEICKSPANGHHFGVVSCRACAAFFRRAILAKRIRTSCRFSNTCSDFRGISKPPCKSCRMAKCLEVGMCLYNLQEEKQTVETALSRPTMVLTPKIASNRRTFVDVNHLVKFGFEILIQGAPTPLDPGLSQLERMHLGSVMSTSNKTCEKVTFVDKKYAMQIWETDFISAAKWLTHFEEFTILPKDIQMQLLQVTWHIWARLYRIIATSQLCQGNWNEMRVLRFCDKNYVDMEETKADVSWMANCSFEQVKGHMFGDDLHEVRQGVKMVSKLNLSDVEISYMIAQLCFEYAASRFQGKEIAEISEKFQSVLANDLHRYYTSDVRRNKNYAGRLCQILKINQENWRTIRCTRDKTHVARIFDILIVDFSHPEMFIDTGVK